jgi:hypothetical protein
MVAGGGETRHMVGKIVHMKGKVVPMAGKTVPIRGKMIPMYPYFVCPFFYPIIIECGCRSSTRGSNSTATIYKNDKGVSRGDGFVTLAYTDMSQSYRVEAWSYKTDARSYGVDVQGYGGDVQSYKADAQSDTGYNKNI